MRDGQASPRRMSSGPGQLTGGSEGPTSQVKASADLLLATWASTLSYRSRSKAGHGMGTGGGGPSAEHALGLQGGFGSCTSCPGASCLARSV